MPTPLVAYPAAGRVRRYRLGVGVIRLANAAGMVLHHRGEEAESQQHFARALMLQRAAALYQREFPQQDGTIHIWQFAEHIRKWRGTP